MQSQEGSILLALTVGDPAGIGPEVILKALAPKSEAERQQFTIFGDRAVLWQTYRAISMQCGQDYAAGALAHPDSLRVAGGGKLVGELPPLGQQSRRSGQLSFAYLEAAIQETLAGKYGGIVTGPIAKSAWKLAGYDYPGQTELLAQQSHAARYGMLFVATSPITGWQLRTLLATTHIPLSQVPQALTPTLLSAKLALLVDTLQTQFGIARPRIAIPGLNPHSGEQGQLGREELDWIIPWINAMGDRHRQITLDGPIPPDTLWVQPGLGWFGQGSQTPPPTLHDAYLALYHDQGLIPVKLMAFDQAVNTTIGLPFVRTSPDHGTAFDIAGKGVASAASMTAALTLAQSLVQAPFCPTRNPTPLAPTAVVGQSPP